MPANKFVDELVQDRRQENERTRSRRVRAAADDARQDARRLDDGRPGTAPEGIAAFEFDGES
jgi:hypothetical protein